MQIKVQIDGGKNINTPNSNTIVIILRKNLSSIFILFNLSSKKNDTNSTYLSLTVGCCEL